MAGRIPRAFIDDLIARTDIVELIESRVRLKKAGKNYQACCPFHNEKSPSFTVAPDKQFYHCFGCGAHGNAVSFLMEYDNLEFVDAIEDLAARNGIEMQYEQGITPNQPQQSQTRVDYEVMAKAAEYFHQQLYQNTKSQQVLEYVANRGLSEETVKAFQIGYSPDGWDNLLKHLGKSQKEALQLRDLGMLIENDSKRLYDRFRDRLMFPILDRRGKCIGFGGRILGEGQPKYLNSPETRVFQKGKELYGLYQARQANRKLERLLVVEGYMDVVALAQAGITNSVASLGTSTTSDQIQLMLRQTSEIVCCYDGDRAGREAAWRAMENALPYMKDGVSLKFIFLPDGEDPDSFVKAQGKAAFEQEVSNATPLEAFLFEQLSQSADLQSMQGRAKISDQAKPLLEKLPDSDFKQLIHDEFARKLGITSLQQSSKKQKTESSPAQIRKQITKPNKVTPIRMAIALILEQPKLASTLAHMTDNEIKNLNSLQMPGMDLLVQLLLFCRYQPNINGGQILEQFRDSQYFAALAKVMSWQHHVAEENFERTFLDTIERLFSQFVEERKQALKAKSAHSKLSKEEMLEMQQLLRM